MEAPIIELKNVKKKLWRFGGIKRILNVSVGKGEVIVLIGPSGSGKRYFASSQFTSLETIQGGKHRVSWKAVLQLPGKNE